MKKWFLHILLLAGLFSMLTTSCSQEDEGIEKVLSGKKEEKVTVFFTLALDETSARSRATWGDNLDNDDTNNYESAIGDNFDNYINPDQFFVKLNIGNVSYEVSDLVYWQTGTNVYEFVGEVEVEANATVNPQTAKVMVYANMNPDQDTFTVNYDQENGFPNTGVEYIPMWGVQTIQNLSLAPGVRNDLGTIYLLRSMAKVEVIMANSEFEISAINIRGYNNMGKCLPNGWNNAAMTTSLDLEGVFNPMPTYVDDQKPAFKESATEDGFKCYTVYVPEYRNIAPNAQTSVTPSTITVTIDGKDYNIKFKKYEDGAATNEAYNIVRNHIYRFNITGVNSAVETGLNLEYMVMNWTDIDNGTLNFGNADGDVTNDGTASNQ